MNKVKNSPNNDNCFVDGNPDFRNYDDGLPIVTRRITTEGGWRGDLEQIIIARLEELYPDTTENGFHRLARYRVGKKRKMPEIYKNRARSLYIIQNHMYAQFIVDFLDKLLDSGFDLALVGSQVRGILGDINYNPRDHDIDISIIGDRITLSELLKIVSNIQYGPMIKASPKYYDTLRRKAPYVIPIYPKMILPPYFCGNPDEIKNNIEKYAHEFTDNTGSHLRLVVYVNDLDVITSIKIVMTKNPRGAVDSPNIIEFGFSVDTNGITPLHFDPNSEALLFLEKFSGQYILFTTSEGNERHRNFGSNNTARNTIMWSRALASGIKIPDEELRIGLEGLYPDQWMDYILPNLMIVFKKDPVAFFSDEVYRHVLPLVYTFLRRNPIIDKPDKQKEFYETFLRFVDYGINHRFFSRMSPTEILAEFIYRHFDFDIYVPPRIIDVMNEISDAEKKGIIGEFPPKSHSDHEKLSAIIQNLFTSYDMKGGYLYAREIAGFLFNFQENQQCAANPDECILKYLMQIHEEIECEMNTRVSKLKRKVLRRAKRVSL